MNEQETIAFYVAADNQELLNKIYHLMEGKGMVGVKDGYGHFHYLVDGRKGAPFVARRLEDMSRILLREAISDSHMEEANAAFYVDAVLACYPFDRSLQGYEYLRHILISVALDPSTRICLSKKLYPETARFFKVRAAQVERNIRYSLDKLKEREKTATIYDEPVIMRDGQFLYRSGQIRVLDENVPRYSNSMAISLLSNEVREMIRSDKREEKSPAEETSRPQASPIDNKTRVMRKENPPESYAQAF